MALHHMQYDDLELRVRKSNGGIGKLKLHSHSQYRKWLKRQQRLIERKNALNDIRKELEDIDDFDTL